MTDAGGNVKSVEKTIRILECFTKEEQELGISEIARRLSLYKSNVHNLLSTLEKHGYVEQNGLTGGYRLGFKILELAQIITTGTGFRETVYPLLCALASRIEEVVYFGLPRGAYVLYMDVAYPGYTTFSRAITGETAPMYCTAIGKAMLAFSGEETIRAALDSGPLDAFTDDTLTDPAAIRAELGQIRARGYAVDNMEHEYGIKCVGVPVFNDQREVVAGVSASGPSLRFSAERIETISGELISLADSVRIRRIL
jgi:DNA-binding IclR family transcriptional regulator